MYKKKKKSILWKKILSAIIFFSYRILKTNQPTFDQWKYLYHFYNWKRSPFFFLKINTIEKQRVPVIWKTILPRFYWKIVFFFFLSHLPGSGKLSSIILCFFVTKKKKKKKMLYKISIGIPSDPRCLILLFFHR